MSKISLYNFSTISKSEETMRRYSYSRRQQIVPEEYRSW